MPVLDHLRAELLYAAVIRPLRLGKRLMPERLWAPLEVVSRRVGALGGRMARGSRP